MSVLRSRWGNETRGKSEMEERKYRFGYVPNSYRSARQYERWQVVGGWRQFALDGSAATSAIVRRRRIEEENASARLLRRGVDGSALESFGLGDDPVWPVGAADAHKAFRSRRDAAEGHLWARNAGALKVSVTCSDGEPSRWPRLDTAQSSAELQLATWWAEAHVATWLPGDATYEQEQEFAGHAMGWARSIFDRHDIGNRIEQGPAPKKVKTTRIPSLSTRVTAGCKREPQPWSELAPILEPLSPSETWRASLDPQSPPRAVLALEHAATAFLAAHGEHLPRPDVYDVTHRRHLARTDPIAHAAKVRWTPDSPVVVHSGEVVDDDPTLIEYGYQLTHLPVTLTPTPREKITGARRGWIGHESVRFWVQPDRTHTRKVARIARAEVTTTTRGPAVSPWECSERSARRQVMARDELIAAATSICDVLRTTTPGTDVPLEGGASVTVVGIDAVAWSGTTWRMVEWSRRAALAGVVID